MAQISDSLRTALQQWQRQAPASLKVTGRTFKQSRTIPVVFNNKENTIYVSYSARKKRDELVGPMVKVNITYVPGLDLYTVKVLHIDGMWSDSVIGETSGIYGDRMAVAVESIISRAK